MKARLWVPVVGAVALVFGAIAIGREMGLSQSKFGSNFKDQIILEKIQSLGDLHAVKFSYSRIFQHETRRRPAGITEFIPVVSDAIRMSTTNKVLLNTTGQVEAGVDLAKVKITRDSLGNVIATLPPVDVYDPKVDAEVVQTSRGLFWKDENIVPGAIRQAGTVFKASALQQGIVATTKANVESRLRSLLSNMVTNIKFSWITPDSTTKTL